MTGIVETLAVVGGAVASAAPYVTAAASVAGAGLTILSAQRQAASFQSQARQSDFQARQADFQAQQETLRGRQQVNQINAARQRVIAAQSARYAAAGIVLDDGTPMDVADATTAEAERQTTIATGNATISAANATIAGEDRRIRSAQLRDAADTTTATSYLNAGFSMFDLVDRSLARVPGTTTGGINSRRRAAAPGAPSETAGAFAADAALGALY